MQEGVNVWGLGGFAADLLAAPHSHDEQVCGTPCRYL
jgi:hypothetical protein